MPSRLRPMAIRDILDVTFSIIRERLWTFIGVLFYAFLPAFLLLIFGALIIYCSYLFIWPHHISLESSELWSYMFRTFGLQMVLIIILLVLLLLVLVVALIGGSIFMVYGNIQLFKAGLHDEKCTVKQAFSGIKSKLPAMIVTGVLKAIITVPVSFLSMGLVLINPIIGQIIRYILLLLLSVIFSLIPVIIALESLDILASIPRNFKLLSKNIWRFIGTILVVYVLGNVLMLSIACLAVLPIFLAVQFPNVFTILLASICALTAWFLLHLYLPYYYGPLVAIYYDLRIRKEGYDIQLFLNTLSKEGSILA